MELILSRPRFAAEEACAIIAASYGRTGSAVELPSERDQNFRFSEAGSGREFILKISSSAETREILEFQTSAIEHLKREAPEIAWPSIEKSMAGETIITVNSPSGSCHFVRLLSYLPGRFFAGVKPHKPELLESLGAFLGRMDKALLSFKHAAMERELKWDLKKGAVTIARLLPHVEGKTERELIQHFLRLFEEQAVPLLAELRMSVVHNDANDYNVLVGHASPVVEDRFIKVIGIIDFGDMLYSFTVGELAVGAAYAMMGKKDPLAAAAAIVSAYHRVLPLSDTEIQVLYHLVAMRLCLSVTISAEQKKQEKESEYLTISEKPAWALLRQWREVNPRLAYYVFRQACGLAPCAKSEKVVFWLKSHQEDVGPVIEADFRKNPLLFFDLSVGSRELGACDNPDNMKDLRVWMSRRISAAGVEVGVGRYGEVRHLYTSDIFRIPGNDTPEWRTVHLGTDLFIEEGSSVHTPLDGTVYSLQNNKGHLDYGPTVILEHRISEGLNFYTLYGHLTQDSLVGLTEGERIKKGQKIGAVGRFEENGGWPPHLHFQIITDLLGRRGDFPGVAPPSQKDLWLSLCPDPNYILKIPEEKKPSFAMERGRDEIIRLRRTYLGPTLSISYRKPLKIVRGFGQRLYDENGQAYLDAVNNVPHVGHCHPAVVRAAREQMAILNTNTRYLHDYLVEYALRLAETLPDPLRIFYFVSSGSEANDLALRLARTKTGRADIIVINGAYHGNLSSLIEISPYKFDGPGGRGAPPHVHKVLTPDGYRGPHKYENPAAGSLYALAVKQAIETIEEKGRGVAAFICESLMGCAGQIVYPDGFLREAFAHIRKAGGVCIADEVQVGLGRVGTHFWGFETQGVVPDIVTMGKPMGNGHPLAAVVTTPDVAASFDTGMEYFSSFGGNPVSCAVGLAVLDVIRQEKLQENARKVGAYFKSRLEETKKISPLVGDVRGLGLFLGIELVLDRATLAPATAEASYVAERMKDKGVLVSTDGPYKNVLKIKPPLVFTQADADLYVETLAEVLAESALERKDAGC
ncbi:MAG: aminotransferase class III-fold pyridoxal phosphate-dependent enzyme [Clostridiales bacterium]|nr:aminotransferase class III-fold pyridoxal phosphate-dependent enzyme [Clostridiales bacterium]